MVLITYTKYLMLTTANGLFISLLDYRTFKGKLQKDNPIQFALHFDSLDQGTEAFMQWLGSDDKTSASGNPIILKQYEHYKYAVLYDNTLGKDVTMLGFHFAKPVIWMIAVMLENFTILLDQKYENDGSILD